MTPRGDDPIRETEQTLRKLLSGCSALRRDRLLTATSSDPSSLEKAIGRMVGRGEVEVLRPMYASAHHPCFYRLRRESDGGHLAKRSPSRSRPAGRMFDAHEMGLA